MKYLFTSGILTSVLNAHSAQEALQTAIDDEGVLYSKVDFTIDNDMLTVDLSLTGLAQDFKYDELLGRKDDNGQEIVLLMGVLLTNAMWLEGKNPIDDANDIDNDILGPDEWADSAIGMYSLTRK